jgi:hypothetical protein
VCKAAPLCSDPKKELDHFDILHDTHADKVFACELAQHPQLVDEGHQFSKSVRESVTGVVVSDPSSHGFYIVSVCFNGYRYIHILFILILPILHLSFVVVLVAPTVTTSRL